jgi:hypothetical protein
VELRDDVPEHVREVIADVGVFQPSQGEVSDEALVIYLRMASGRCMHCDSPVADEATCLVAEPGVVMLFCSQVCLQDFHNMHWMMTQYDDLVDSAKFRHAAATGETEHD